MSHKQKATLIYNANARKGGLVKPDRILNLLHQAGYAPLHTYTKTEEDIDIILEHLDGVVVVAGGDGTIREIAKKLIGRNIPLAIIPLGTANNIAKTLKIAGTVEELVLGLQEPDIQKIDIGHISAPWGEHYFFEGVGYGFFADVLAAYDPDKGKSILRSLQTLRKELSDIAPYHGQMRLDNHNLTGDYVLVEILCAEAIGPRLLLAPNADPTDGMLDVICITQNQQVRFLDYLINTFSGDIDDLPGVGTYKGRKISFMWTGFHIHLDGKILPPEHFAFDKPTTITVKVIPKGLELWRSKNGKNSKF